MKLLYFSLLTQIICNVLFNDKLEHLNSQIHSLLSQYSSSLSIDPLPHHPISELFRQPDSLFDFDINNRIIPKVQIQLDSFGSYELMNTRSIIKDDSGYFNNHLLLVNNGDKISIFDIKGYLIESVNPGIIIDELICFNSPDGH